MDTAERVANYITIIILIAMVVGIGYGLNEGHKKFTAWKAEQEVRRVEIELDRQLQMQKAHEVIFKRDKEPEKKSSSDFDTTMITIINDAAFVAGTL